MLLTVASAWRRLEYKTIFVLIAYNEQMRLMEANRMGINFRYLPSDFLESGCPYIR